MSADSLRMVDELIDKVTESEEDTKTVSDSSSTSKSRTVNDHGLKGKKMEGKCMCELCRLGLATTHNDASHDQSLFGHFSIPSALSYYASSISDEDSTHTKSAITSAPSSCSELSSSIKEQFPGLDLRLIGGSTKCGRTMSKWFADRVKGGTQWPNEWTGKRILEVGSGTGIVGISLAYLMGDSKDSLNPGLVCVTDQSYVLEVLEENCNENLFGKHDGTRQRLVVNDLVWSVENAQRYLVWPPSDRAMEIIAESKDAERKSDDETTEEGRELTEDEEALLFSADLVQLSEPQKWDVLVGSDLIYAHESIEPLVRTFETLSSENTIVFMAIIRRFKWEERFFELMQQSFKQEMVHEDGDIALYRYTRLIAAADVDSSKVSLI